MSFFEGIKLDAVKSVEGLLGDAFQYQTQKLLNAPVLARLTGANATPAGNLTAVQIEQGQRGQTAPIPTGNSNGPLQNSVTSPWVSNKMIWIGGGVLIILIVFLLVGKK